MPSDATALARFLPRMVVHHLRSLTAGPAEAREQRFVAAIMLADVSGFTALSERLSQLGATGPERLTRTLNGFFDPLIERIHRTGGDVLKFAGDALVVVWPGTGADADAGVAALQATGCGLTLQEYAEHQQVGDERLRLKVAVGVGPMRVQHIGGSGGRWELLVTGEGLSSLAEVTYEVQSGEVLITRDARALLGDRVAAEPVEGSTGYRVTSVVGPAPQAAAEAAAPGDLPPDALIRGYVPEAVVSRYAIQGEAWLSELRPISVLFINFPNATYATPLDRAQTIMLDLQKRLDRFEGAVNKISVDEKGVSVVAVFGTPPNAHPDDPSRAVLAALALQQGLRASSVKNSMGIASGAAFCGVVGGTSRREYTVLGDTVNLAARLMQAAHGGLLCDAATAERASARVAFEGLPPLVLKGKSQPVPVFRPTGEREARAQVETPLLGRAEHLARLRAALQAATAGRPGAPLVIVGEAGMGKSRMMAEATRLCDALALPRLMGAADPLERDAPYFAWRTVLSSLLAPVPVASADRQGRISQRLEELGLSELGALLNPLLSLSLPETPATGELSGPLRGENTRELLLKILAARSAQGPTAVLIEDAHWFDGASWWLAAKARERAPNLLLVLTTRQPEPPVPAELVALLSEGGRLELGPLAPADALVLARHRLGVDALSTDAARLISERGGGHPYFTEELAYALRDSGRLRIEAGVASLDGSRSLDAADLPPTIQGMIAQRVDRLRPELQLTLKTASVVGRSFSLRLLRAVHPHPTGAAPLDQQLDELARLDLTPVDHLGHDPLYSFKHALTREAVYGAVLSSTRRELHAAIGSWYEQELADALPAHAALLAHHWGQSGDVERARSYLELAGTQALQSGAPREAAAFMAQAISLEPDGADALLPRARRRRLWGEALLNSGHLDEARAALDQAVDLIAVPMPVARPLWAARLLVQAARQLGHRTLRQGPELTGILREQAVEGARAQERLGEVCFFQNQPEGTLFCTVAAVNLAERAGLQMDLSRVYGSVALGTSLLRLPSVTRRYERLALDALATPQTLTAEGWARMVLAMVQLAEGRLIEAGANLERSGVVNERLGDLRRHNQGRMIQALVLWLTGDIAGALTLVTATTESSRRSSDQHMQSGANAHLGYLLLQVGRRAEARDRLEEAARCADAVRALPEQVYARGLLALSRVHEDRVAEAREEVERALAIQRKLLPTAVYAMEGYAALAEAAMEIDLRQPEAPRLANDAMRGLERYSRTFTIAQPRALLLKGRLAAQRGRKREALRWLEQSLQTAERLELPGHGALARAELDALPRDV